MRDWAATLEEDLRWREAELASLKRIAITQSDNEAILRASLRASWALLYAHYEGFTKFCWNLLLDRIEYLGVPVEELSEEFLLLALEKRFRGVKGNTSTMSLWSFFNDGLPVALKEKATFAVDCRLETESNLWPTIFERECARIGIYSAEMSSNRTRIKTLVSRRNDIAHGTGIVIKTVNEFTEYENCTLLVMHELAVKILDILENEKYKA